MQDKFSWKQPLEYQHNEFGDSWPQSKMKLAAIAWLIVAILAALNFIIGFIYQKSEYTTFKDSMILNLIGQILCCSMLAWIA